MPAKKTKKNRKSDPPSDDESLTEQDSFQQIVAAVLEAVKNQQTAAAPVSTSGASAAAPPQSSGSPPAHPPVLKEWLCQLVFADTAEGRSQIVRSFEQHLATQGGRAAFPSDVIASAFSRGLEKFPKLHQTVSGLPRAQESDYDFLRTRVLNKEHERKDHRLVTKLKELMTISTRNYANTSEFLNAFETLCLAVADLTSRETVTATYIGSGDERTDLDLTNWSLNKTFVPQLNLLRAEQGRLASALLLNAIADAEVRANVQHAIGPRLPYHGEAGAGAVLVTFARPSAFSSLAVSGINSAGRQLPRPDPPHCDHHGHHPSRCLKTTCFCTRCSTWGHRTGDCRLSLKEKLEKYFGPPAPPSSSRTAAQVAATLQCAASPASSPFSFSACAALLDTGTSATVGTRGWFRQHAAESGLVWEEVPLPTPQYIRTAGGSHVLARFQARLPCFLGDHPTVLMIAIMETEEVTLPLIGNARLRDLHASFDYATGRLHFPSSSLPSLPSYLPFIRAENDLYWIPLRPRSEPPAREVGLSLPFSFSTSQPLCMTAAAAMPAAVDASPSAPSPVDASPSAEMGDCEMRESVHQLIRDHHDWLGHAGIHAT